MVNNLVPPEVQSESFCFCGYKTACHQRIGRPDIVTGRRIHSFILWFSHLSIMWVVLAEIHIKHIWTILKSIIRLFLFAAYYFAGTKTETHVLCVYDGGWHSSSGGFQALSGWRHFTKRSSFNMQWSIRKLHSSLLQLREETVSGQQGLVESICLLFPLMHPASLSLLPVGQVLSLIRWIEMIHNGLWWLINLFPLSVFFHL